MKAVLAASLLFAGAAANDLQVGPNRAEQMANLLSNVESLQATTCSRYIDRVKKGPIDYKTYI